MPRYESVNPGRTGVHGHRLDREAVRYYESNPGGRYRGGGGEVVGYRQPDGSVWVVNGAHRRQAAINQGRNLRLRVYEQGERKPAHETGGCCLVLVALAGGASAAVWAVAELARAVLPI